MWTRESVYALPANVSAMAFHMDPETWNSMGLPIAQDIVLCYMTLALVYCVTANVGAEDRWALTHEIWWYPFSLILVYYACSGAVALSGDVEARWGGTCPEAFKFIRLYVAAQMLAIPIELLGAGSWKAKLPMIGHHAVSIGGYLCGLKGETAFFFCCAAGLSEVSTIFLEGVLLSKRKEFKTFFDTYAPWFLAANGALLWLSYIIFRLLLFPLLLAIHSYDKYVLKPPITLYENSPSAVAVVPSALVFLFALSVVWFSKIHKGFMTKVLGAIKPGDDKKKSS